jgi:hypothetical protein
VRNYAFWSEDWHSTEERVGAVSAELRAVGAVIRSGGDWDRWDLAVRGGLLGGARLRLAIEEHGAGRQLVRVRSWPHISSAATVLGALVASLAGLAALSGAGLAAGALGLLALLLGLRLAFECGTASATIRLALRGPAATRAEIPGEAGHRSVWRLTKATR